MAVPHAQHAKGRTAKNKTDSDLDFRYTTREGAWYAYEPITAAGDSMDGGVASNSIRVELELIEQRLRLGDNDFTTSMGSRSTGSEQAGSSFGSSIQTNYGSLSEPLPHQRGTAASLGSYDRATPQSRHDYRALSDGQDPPHLGHTWYGADVSHPTPLEMWESTSERHESIAYRLEQPPARKHRSSTKHKTGTKHKNSTKRQ
jgi:hypothetical protein